MWNLGPLFVDNSTFLIIGKFKSFDNRSYIQWCKENNNKRSSAQSKKNKRKFKGSFWNLNAQDWFNECLKCVGELKIFQFIEFICIED